MRNNSTVFFRMSFLPPNLQNNYITLQQYNKVEELESFRLSYWNVQCKLTMLSKKNSLKTPKVSPTRLSSDSAKMAMDDAYLHAFHMKL